VFIAAGRQSVGFGIPLHAALARKWPVVKTTIHEHPGHVFGLKHQNTLVQDTDGFSNRVRGFTGDGLDQADD